MSKLRTTYYRESVEKVECMQRKLMDMVGLNIGRKSFLFDKYFFKIETDGCMS